MCMEDKRIGRETGGNESFVAVGTTKAPVIGPAPNRTMLVLCPPASGDVYVTSLPGSAATDGIKMSAGGSPLTLLIEYHGELVRKSWYAAAPGGATSITVLEGLLAKE